MDSEPSSGRKMCKDCLRPIPVCFCSAVSAINNEVPVTILQHPNESKHPLNSAKIAELCLQECQVITGEDFSNNEYVTQLIQSTENLWLVYPGEDSQAIDKLIPIDPKSPPKLIFLDGTWRKTRRMLHTSNNLQTLPKLTFIPRQPSNYRLRKSPSPLHLSTVEAIAEVLGTFEDNEEKYRALKRCFDFMIDQQLKYIDAPMLKAHYGL